MLTPITDRHAGSGYACRAHVLNSETWTIKPGDWGFDEASSLVVRVWASNTVISTYEYTVHCTVICNRDFPSPFAGQSEPSIRHALSRVASGIKLYAFYYTTFEKPALYVQYIWLGSSGWVWARCDPWGRMFQVDNLPDTDWQPWGADFQQMCKMAFVIFAQPKCKWQTCKILYATVQWEHVKNSGTNEEKKKNLKR